MTKTLKKVTPSAMRTAKWQKAFIAKNCFGLFMASDKAHIERGRGMIIIDLDGDISMTYYLEKWDTKYRGLFEMIKQYHPKEEFLVGFKSNQDYVPNDKKINRSLYTYVGGMRVWTLPFKSTMALSVPFPE